MLTDVLLDELQQNLLFLGELVLLQPTLSGWTKEIVKVTIL